MWLSNHEASVRKQDVCWPKRKVHDKEFHDVATSILWCTSEIHSTNWPSPSYPMHAFDICGPVWVPAGWMALGCNFWSVSGVTHEIRNTQADRCIFTFNDSLILLSMVASDSRLKAPDVNDLISAFFVFAHAYADASLSRMLRNAQGTPSKLHKMNNC